MIVRHVIKPLRKFVHTAFDLDIDDLYHCLWIDVTPCLPRWVVIFSPGFLGFDLPGLLPYCFMIPVKFRHELPLGSLVIQGMFLNHHIPSCLQSIPFN